MAALTLFYCYAHQDEALRDQLEKHLVLLRREGMILEWYDRKILPGGAWADEIDTHLETASIILLLVSSDFLASDYCYEHEMQRALERHRHRDACVIPIILRDCDWQHSPLKDLQCLPRDGKPVMSKANLDETFADITKELRKVIEQRQALPHPFIPLSPLNRQNRIRMLKQVQRVWIDGLLTPSLHHAARMELRLQDRPDILENPLLQQVQELNQNPQVLPDGTTIVQVYDEADGELLILGEPGSGKTTLLLELTATLLERAEKDERLRMPIMFHLSSWARKRQPLRTWMVEELWRIYQVPRKIGQSWIDADQVLPLLDGLDEVAKATRPACVEQINTYYQSQLERGGSPIVVCCRSEEYAALSTHVMLQHAVSILPLNSEQINTYLEQAGKPAKGLKEVLDEDAELHSLARQPLMLNIFTLAYQGETVAEIPTGGTHEEVRRIIFAKYVKRMLKRRVQSKHWKSEQVIRWLTFLATQIQQHDQTVFSVETLQPTWLSRWWRLLYKWCVWLLLVLALFPFTKLVVGLVSSGLLSVDLFFWSFLGLLWAPLFDAEIDPAEALTFIWSWKNVGAGLECGLGILLICWLGISGRGLGYWLFAGLLLGLFNGLIQGIYKAEAPIWSWKSARSGLKYGLTFGLAFGLIFGGFFWMEGDLGRHLGLIGGLITMLVFGLLNGPLLGLSGRRLLERLSLSPNEGIWRSGKNGLVVSLFFVMIGGLIGWLVFGLSSGLPGGLAFGLLGGFVFGLLRGLGAFVKHFILRFLLSRRGDLPWDLVPFLDEATERLLLRKVGGSYIFVHRLLQEYIMELGRKDGSHK